MKYVVLKIEDADGDGPVILRTASEATELAALLLEYAKEIIG